MRSILGTLLVATAITGGVVPAQRAVDEDTASSAAFRAFPEADSCKRIRRDVDRDTRAAIERSLPFRLHFDELGTHTLLVAFRGRRPVGLVYLRSEESEYGLTEVQWALSLDLRVLGFELPRCRNQNRHALETSPFAKELAGCDSQQLVALFQRDPPVTRDPAHVPPGAEQLADVVLRSALKSLRVAELVWHEDIAKLQDQAMGFDAFPAAERFRRQVLQFAGEEGDPAHLRSVTVVLAIGRNGSSFGTVVRTAAVRPGSDGDRATLRWVLDEEQRVLSVSPLQSWSETPLRVACRELSGRRLTDPDLPPNDLLPVARELAVVLQRLAERSAQR